jgi:glutathione S-transferase
LESVKPSPTLIPEDPFAAAKAVELACHIKLNVELVARRCLPEALFNTPVSDETKASTEKDLNRGMQAVGQLMVCDPYAAGDTFSIADLYTYYSFGLASTIGQTMFNKDILADYPKISDLIKHLAERPSIKRVTEEASA